MAFGKESSKTPQSIGEITVRLETTAAGGRAVFFRVEVVMSDGSLVYRTGDLAPHLTAQQRTALSNFMDALRVQAAAEIL